MRHLLLLLALVFVTGCKPKSSREYHQLEAEYSVMVARDGDEAYADPQMEVVLAKLKGISTDVREADKIASLVRQIESETARIAKDKDAKAKMLAASRQPTNAVAFPSSGQPSVAVRQPAEPSVTAEAPDAGPAGPPKPYGGMLRTEFLKHYARCVNQGEPVQMPGAKEPAPAYEVRDQTDCQALLGVGPGFTAFVFVKDKLEGQVHRTEQKTVTVFDAGTKTIPAVPPKEFIIIPGAPIPAELSGGYDAGGSSY